MPTLGGLFCYYYTLIKKQIISVGLISSNSGELFVIRDVKMTLNFLGEAFNQTSVDFSYSG